MSVAGGAPHAPVPTLQLDVDTTTYAGPDRRGPARATNVVRPAFVKPARADAGLDPSAPSTLDSDEWEPF